MSRLISWCPRQDSNLRTRFRKPTLYPLSYEGGTSARNSAKSSARKSSLSLRASGDEHWCDLPGRRDADISLDSRTIRLPLHPTINSADDQIRGRSQPQPLVSFG